MRVALYTNALAFTRAALAASPTPTDRFV